MNDGLLTLRLTSTGLPGTAGAIVSIVMFSALDCELVFAPLTFKINIREYSVSATGSTFTPSRSARIGNRPE